MSECVVSMEMPKDKNCLLNFSLPKIGPWCWIEDRACDYYKTNNRPDWCPIICQLPEGHGRLVDKDDLMELMLERKQPLVGADNSKDRYRYMQWLADFNAIEDTKTIVPAERNE